MSITDNLFDFYERSYFSVNQTSCFADIANRSSLVKANKFIAKLVNEIDQSLVFIEETRTETFEYKKARVVIGELLSIELHKALDSHLLDPNYSPKSIAELSIKVLQDKKDYEHAGTALTNLFESLDNLIRSRTHFTKKNIKTSTTKTEDLKKDLGLLNTTIEKLSKIIKEIIQDTSIQTKDLIESEIIESDHYPNIKDVFYQKLPKFKAKLNEMLGLRTNKDGTPRKKLQKKMGRKPIQQKTSKEVKPFYTYSDVTGTTHVYRDGAIIKEYTESDGSKKSMIIRKGNKPK